MMTDLYLKKQDWQVRVYILPDNTDAVLQDLADMGCRGKNMQRAQASLHSRIRNTGLTYTNARNRQSLIVLGRTTSPQEFLDSVVHETTHLAVHIARTDKINPDSEALCYIAGDAAREMYPYIRESLCCACHT